MYDVTDSIVSPTNEQWIGNFFGSMTSSVLKTLLFSIIFYAIFWIIIENMKNNLRTFIFYVLNMKIWRRKKMVCETIIKKTHSFYFYSTLDSIQNIVKKR